MLVVAMIPMSAAAAEYEPASGFTPVVDGTLTKTADGWAAEFNYGATHEVKFEITNGSEKISYIDSDSNTVANATSIMLWEKDGAPAPVEFWVVNGTEESKHYTLTWSVKAAASDVSVKEAKIGNYTAPLSLHCLLAMQKSLILLRSVHLLHLKAPQALQLLLYLTLPSAPMR